MDATQDLQLPLSSLRPFVSPIRLMSASMWQVAEQRNVQQYGKLEEFVTLVTEWVPELLTFSQRFQIILELRAGLILELCQSQDSLDCQTIQRHLDSIHLCAQTFGINREDVETSTSNFVELVQTLMKDPAEREHFFKEQFLVCYYGPGGPRYDRALQRLVWKFLSRLEKLLPVLSFLQAASCFESSESDLGDLGETFSDPDTLTTLLQQISKVQLDKNSVTDGLGRRTEVGHHIFTNDLQLPLSSLRLFVSPLCLVSASMWQVAEQRNVQQYGKLEKFVTLVTELLPELLTFSQRAQLILGLKATLVLGLCQNKDSLDLQTIQSHLDRIQLCVQTFGNNVEEYDPSWWGAFVEMVQDVMKDPATRETFFREHFLVYYGRDHDIALQGLVWEFLSRLEKLLPVLSFSQAASCFGSSESDLEDLGETFSDPDTLTTLLQQISRTEVEHHIFTNGPISINSDVILATLSLIQDDYTVNKLQKRAEGSR